MTVKRRAARHAVRRPRPPRAAAQAEKPAEPNETSGDAPPAFSEVSVEGADQTPGTRGERAIKAFQEAATLDAIPRLCHGDEIVYAMEAEKARAKGASLLEPAAPLSVSAGEAVTWENKAIEPFKGAQAMIVDTLENPDTISAGASGQRMRAALEVGVLEPAVDAAKTAQAANSIEKMLCHGMTAAHFMAMRLYKQTTDLVERCASQHHPPTVEIARLTNAAARQLEIYQSGCLTLQKLKTGGRQQVLVQHQQVNVGPGGQAVVAGRLGRGSRTGGTRKNRR